MDFVEVTGNPGGGKYSGEVVVPGTVEYDGITYTVKGVGDRAFEGCGDLGKSLSRRGYIRSEPMPSLVAGILNVSSYLPR